MESLIDEHIIVPYFEIITNPQMEVADLWSIIEDSSQASCTTYRRHHHRQKFTPQLPCEGFRCRRRGLVSTKYISGGATGLEVSSSTTAISTGRNPLHRLYGRRARHRRTFAFTARLKQEIIPNFGTLMTHKWHTWKLWDLKHWISDTTDRHHQLCGLHSNWNIPMRIKEINYTGLRVILLRSQYSNNSCVLPGAMLTIDLDSKRTMLSVHWSSATDSASHQSVRQ